MANKIFNTDIEVWGIVTAGAFVLEDATGTRVLIDDGSTREIDDLFDGSGFVTLATEQTITAAKTFTQNISGVGYGLSTYGGSAISNGVFGGTGDGGTLDNCNLDIKSWWGIGMGYTYTGSYVRTIAFDARDGNIQAQGSIAGSKVTIFDNPAGVYSDIIISDGIFIVQNPYDLDGSSLFSVSQTQLSFGIDGSVANFALDDLNDNRNYNLPDKSGTIALVSDIQGNFLKLTGTDEREYLEGKVSIANGEDVEFYTWDGDNGAKIYWEASSNSIGLKAVDVNTGTVKFELRNGKATYSSLGISGSSSGKLAGEIDNENNAIPGNGSVAPKPLGADRDYSAWYGDFDFTQKGYIVENYVNLFTSQEIEGVKDFTDTVRLHNPLELYDSANDGFGRVVLNDDIYQFKGYSNSILFQVDSGFFGVRSNSAIYGTLNFNQMTAPRNYNLPDKSGTIALLDDIKVVGGNFMTKSGTQNVTPGFVIQSTGDSGFKIDEGSSYPTMYWGNRTFSITDDGFFTFSNGQVEISGSNASLYVTGDITSYNNGSASQWGTAIFNRGALVNNVNFASNSLATGYYANETPNGSGNTNLPIAGYGVFQRIKSNSFTFDMMAYNHGDLYFKTFFRGSEDGTVTAWKKVLTDTDLSNAVLITGNQTIAGTKTFSSAIVGSLTGNASTATSAATLTTARTINGTSFNGSVNITTANWGTSRTLKIGSTSKSVDGSVNVDWTLAEIGAVGITNTETISGTKTFSSLISANGGLKLADTYEGGATFQIGNGDGATLTTANADFSSWWGIGMGHTYTGNYVRTLVIDCRSGNVISAGTFTGTAFYESSLRKFKENIKPFDISGLELINALEIVTFDKIDGPKNKIGIILDETPKQFASESGEEVDLYKTIFIQAKAIQELSKENADLKSEMQNLRNYVMQKLG